MPQLKKVFTAGRMNKDADIRLLPQGEYRHAENTMVLTSEGSDVGTIQNVLSNKKITNFQFTGTVHTITPNPCVYEGKNRIYWLVKDNVGCYLFEYNTNTEIFTPILQDTRPLNTRVLNLDENFLITGIEILKTETEDRELLIWTDNNMEVCCINIQRAKTWGANNFDYDDIYLIKKTPLFAPRCLPILTDEPTNFIEEKFLLFAYRYKYEDNFYSALSSFTAYQFNPKEYEIDYITTDNMAMLNAFNAINIEFNTGDHRVKEIQIMVKESYSSTPFLVEKFVKEEQGWSNNQTVSYTYKNNKIHTSLPENELLRSFDNVPRKAKALSLINNWLTLSNYTENYNIDTVIDFETFFYLKDVMSFSEYSKTVSTNTFLLTNPTQYQLKRNGQISFRVRLKYLNINSIEELAFDSTFFYILPNDFADTTTMFLSDSFQLFLSSLNTFFVNNKNINIPGTWNVQTEPEITLSGNTFSVSNATFLNGVTPVDVPLFWDNALSVFSYSETSSNATCKSNRDYETGIIYLDTYHRKTTVLTSKNNTTHIPHENSTGISSLGIRINHKAPSWAKYYKIAVRTEPLTYNVIIVNHFYKEGSFAWLKLEGGSKDKVKEGDYLILKSAPSFTSLDPIKVKILQAEAKELDFIQQNTDADGDLAVEPAGFYVKINPIGFNMDFSAISFLRNGHGAETLLQNFFPTAYVDLFDVWNTSTNQWEPRPIIAGSSISLDFNSTFHYDAGVSNHLFKETFLVNQNYASFEAWYNDIISPRAITAITGHNYRPKMAIVKGWFVPQPISLNQTQEAFFENALGKTHLKIVGAESGDPFGGRRGRVTAVVIVRISGGDYIFETETLKKVEQEIFFETEQTFLIDEDGNHLTEVLADNQDISINKPATIDLKFHNCYAFGNGLESYQIKDSFNKPKLSIDTRANAVSSEPYKENIRFADITYSSLPYNESSNINGLNNFNLSTANWKELDKQYGSIQRTHSRMGDLLVLQEEKAGRTLFGKNALYSAEGVPVITKIPEVLGQYTPYHGNNGIGLNPESFANDNYRYYWFNTNFGTPIRLSIDGTTEINYGHVSYFRELAINNRKAKKIGGFDPYHKFYTLTIEDEPEFIEQISCGVEFFKILREGQSFVYEFVLNNLTGKAIISYNIVGDVDIIGEVNITAEYGNETEVFSGLTGNGTIEIDRDDINDFSTIKFTIEATSEVAEIQISHACPLGLAFKLFEIVLADSLDIGQNITNRFKWNTSPYYSEVITLSSPLTKFEEFNGVEGQGKFPIRNNDLFIESLKTQTQTGRFYTDRCNRLGYLVTNTIYTQADINTILVLVTWLTVTEQQVSPSSWLNKASFLFNRADDQHLYLIWDYTDRKPIANDESINLSEPGDDQIINVLANDIANGSPITITIITPPTNGTAVVNLDNTITYEHDGSENLTDSFVYRLSNGICSDDATVSISVGEQNVGCFKLIEATYDTTDVPPNPLQLNFNSCEEEPYTFNVLSTQPINICINPISFFIGTFDREILPADGNLTIEDIQDAIDDNGGIIEKTIIISSTNDIIGTLTFKFENCD